MATKIFLKVLKTNFPIEFSDCLVKCIKAKSIFHLKENVIPVFKPKRSLPSEGVEPNNK